MAKEYKTLIFNDTPAGRAKMAEQLSTLSKGHWTIQSKEVSQQGYAPGKTCCLGCLFLPLALLGKKEGIITVIMEREVTAGLKKPTSTDNKDEK